MKATQYLKISTPIVESGLVLDYLGRKSQWSVESFNPEELLKERLENSGLTNILAPEYDEFIGTPHDRTEDILQALFNYLDKIITTTNLIITDAYIFSSDSQDYEKLLMEIFKRYIAKLSNIVFIIRKDHKINFRQKIFSNIQSINPSISLDIVISEEFHDRYWISNYNGKGVVIGTSLNGIGKKYCLIDYINKSDVRALMKDISKII